MLLTDHACAHGFVLGTAASGAWRSLDLTVHEAMIADVAGARGLGGAAGDALGLTANVPGRQFPPPFISLGAAKLSLYHAALREGLPGTVPQMAQSCFLK